MAHHIVRVAKEYYDLLKPYYEQMHGLLVIDNNFVIGEEEEKAKMTEDYIKGYRDGFKAGIDVKDGWKFTIFGMDVVEVLKILSEHKLKENDGMPYGFEFPSSKRNEWTECVNNLRKQGFKISK